MQHKWITFGFCVAVVASLSACGAAEGGLGQGRGRNGMAQTPQVSHYAEAESLFRQLEYTDEETGLTIPYNLYLPENYDESKTYPLVVYIADASVNSDEVTDVLKQDGAAVWASKEEQAKHECIVLAPQYTQKLLDTVGAMTEDDNLWIVVCEGDAKAYPGMNEATANWKSLGSKVATSEMWDSTSSPEEFAALVSDMEAQDCNINYTVFSGGDHMYTWSVAYTIEGIRDWMFSHSRS